VNGKSRRSGDKTPWPSGQDGDVDEARSLNWSRAASAPVRLGACNVTVLAVGHGLVAETSPVPPVKLTAFR